MSQTVCSEQLCVLINTSMLVRVEIQQTASFCDTILLLNSYCKSGFCGGNGECKVTLYTETWTFHKILFKYNKNSTNKK